MTHGKRSTYTAGCRCERCRTAQRTYVREWLRKEARIRYGIEERIDPYIDATEARDHLIWLQSKGIGRRLAAQHARLAPSTITKIRTGTIKTIRPETAARILAVNLTALPERATIDGTKSARQIDELLEAGWTKVALARAITGNPNTKALQVHRERITIRNAERIDRIWRDTFARQIAQREMVRDQKRAYREAQRAG
jgi:hypothetical protein